MAEMTATAAASVAAAAAAAAAAAGGGGGGGDCGRRNYDPQVAVPEPPYRQPGVRGI
jgi:hypothetical protein